MAVHLGGGCGLALAYVYLPFPALRIGVLVALCLATIAATLAAIRLWRPARRKPFLLFAAGEVVGFAAGALGSSAAVTRAGGSVAGRPHRGRLPHRHRRLRHAHRARSPGRDQASLIDATVISTGVGMLAWVFLATPYSVDASLPLVERVLSMVYIMLDVLVLALVIRMAIGAGDRSRAYLLMTPAGWSWWPPTPGGRCRAAGHLRPLQPRRGRLRAAVPAGADPDGRPGARERGGTVRDAPQRRAVAILAEDTDLDAARLLAERAIATLGAPFPLVGGQVTIQASVGIATDDGHGLDEAHSCARRHRHLRRQEPRQGHLRGVQGSMLVSVRDRHAHRALEGAIERRELVVHYQPIVDLHNGRVAGAERWCAGRGPTAV